MHEIYELKEMLMKELEEYGRKGEMSAGSLEIVDKLAHAIKNLCKIIEAAEEEEEGYSRRGGSYYYEGGRGGQGGGSNYARRGGGGQGGNSSYYREGGQGGGSSYARGRGRNAQRDSRGRYSRTGGSMYYRNTDELVEQLEELMEDAPNEQIKQRMNQLVQELGQM